MKTLYPAGAGLKPASVRTGGEHVCAKCKKPIAWSEVRIITGQGRMHGPCAAQWRKSS